MRFDGTSDRGIDHDSRANKKWSWQARLLRSFGALLLSDSGLLRDDPYNCAILLTRPMFSGSNSCLNKRAYQTLKEPGYRKLKEAGYRKLKAAEHAR